MIAGIDIGGTHVRVALMRANRVVSFKKESAPRSLPALLARITAMAGTDIKHISAVGAGVPGVVISRSGAILRAPNAPWLKGISFARGLRRIFGVPVRIDNDLRCFLRAETMLGAAKKCRNAVGVAVGTGIGGALLINGILYEGAHSGAGEVGHTVFCDGKEWEEVAGKKFFRKLGSGPEQISVKARSGSAAARKAFNERGRLLGLGIANIVNILDPETVVLGGGAIADSAFFLPELRKTAAKHIFNPSARRVKIVTAKLGERVGAIGAALLFARTH